MKYLITLCLSFTCYAHAAMSTAGQESDHFFAEFWQRPDGVYCVKLIQFDDPEDLNNHIYTFKELVHSELCPCTRWLLNY